MFLLFFVSFLFIICHTQPLWSQNIFNNISKQFLLWSHVLHGNSFPVQSFMDSQFTSSYHFIFFPEQFYQRGRMGEDNINQEKSLSHLSTRVRHGTGDRCPVVFSELQCNTNLNLPPANWLSGINKRYGIKFNTGSPDEFSR